MIAWLFLYVIVAVCVGVLILQINDFTKLGRFMVPTIGGLLWPVLGLLLVALLLVAYLNSGEAPEDL